MGLIAASILTIFLNKEEDKKILACLLILYIILLELIIYYKYLVFKDYLDVYMVATLCLSVALYTYANKDYYNKLLALSVILPHLYYLFILYKPYALVEGVPMWWLFSADSFFIYGVFFILYGQKVEFNFKKMKFKDFILNITILLLLVLF